MEAIRFPRKNKPKSFIDMVPMIDIIFQLIIFFMFATTLKTIDVVELNLPTAKYVTNIPTSPLNISVVDKETIYVDKVKMNLTQFEALIENEAKKNDKSKNIVVYGNREMEYQLLIDVMDILRINGFESIDLALNKKVD
ncbi:MAG TPA: biopolymer transporter ExbD [Spirochaetota bacterium]|nr:biopolymer transporter ExbD [Spirochaetota bacterium]